MTLVGFKRLRIQPFDKDGVTPLGDVIVIEGKTNEGATTEVEISGLTKEAKAVAGSNIAYYSSRKGVGEVKAQFGVLDLPETEVDRILGYEADSNGIVRIGSTTEAPYCGVIMESENMQGDKALFGFYKGTFSRDSLKAKTLDPSEDFEPEAEEMTFTALGSDKPGDANGQYVAKYFGSDSAAITALETEILGKATSAASISTKSAK